MSLASNADKVSFTTKYPVDKIVYQSSDFTSSVSAGDVVAPVTSLVTVAHTAGAETVVSGRFSIDNVNFYPFGAYLPGTVISGNQEYLQLTGYNDDTNVYVRFVQAFETPLTVYWNFVMESLA